MYARITRYKMKPDHLEGATERVKGMMSEIMAMPGIVQFINSCDDDGNGYIVSIMESKEASDAVLPTVQGIWAQFADDLETMPTPEGFDVIINERNS